MPATLAALGAIFQAFPVLCPREPRLPRGEMQAVPCGARSNTRLFPASVFQPPLAGIRFVRNYNTGMCVFVQVKKSLHSDTSSYPARAKQIHRFNHAHRRFRSCFDERRPARRESAGRFTLVCSHAHAPTSRSAADTAQGGAPPNPTLVRFICVLLLLLYAAATAAAAEVNSVRAGAATVAVLLLRFFESFTNKTTKNKVL